MSGKIRKRNANFGYVDMSGTSPTIVARMGNTVVRVRIGNEHLAWIIGNLRIHAFKHHTREARAHQHTADQIKGQLPEEVTR